MMKGKVLEFINKRNGLITKNTTNKEDRRYMCWDCGYEMAYIPDWKKDEYGEYWICDRCNSKVDVNFDPDEDIESTMIKNANV